MLKIYTDANGNIKAIGSTDNPDLTAHEVGRERVFPAMSDARILCYRYVPQDGGYMITPAIDINLIDAIDRAVGPMADLVDALILDQLATKGVIEI